jgi:hypothetical protein
MRKLLAYAITALMAAALAAPVASAQVEVESVSSNAMCDDTAEGFCEVDLEADLATVVMHTFFGEFTYVCDISVTSHLASDGTAWTEIDSIDDEAGGTSNCGSLSSCFFWDWQVEETFAAEEITIDACIHNGLVQCDGDLHSGPLTEFAGSYSFELTDIELEGDSTCEISGDFSFGAFGGIEIHHT